VSKDLPIPSPTADHWHLVTANPASGEMQSHGIWMVYPVTLPANAVTVAKCQDAACFAQHWQAIGLMTLAKRAAAS
jgi:hypothetical protein